MAEPLRNHTDALLHALFQEVCVVGRDCRNEPEEYQAVIEPKIIAMSWERPMYVYERMETVLIVEWSFYDLDRNLIWVDTVRGVGIDKLSNQTAQIDQAIADLFRKSYERIHDAFEIRRFAMSFSRRQSPFPSK